MKRVCFVVDSFISDGDAMITGPMVQTYLLGKELTRRGWIVTFVAYTREQTTGPDEFEGLRIYWVPSRRWLPLLSSFRILRQLNRANADYYYQRGRDILTGISAYYCRRRGKTFIWASAGERGVEKSKYRSQLRRRNIPLYRRIPLWLESAVNDLVCHYGISHADRIVVQTAVQQKRLKESFGRDSTVIKSGHPLPARPERALPFKILWIGSIKKVKRPELFVRLAELCSDQKCAFWMAGQIVDGRLRPLIHSAVERLPRFKYLGPVPFESSQQVISSAHVLVNTTDDGFEGLPNAFVQAWLAGTVTLSLHSDPDGVISCERLGAVNSDLTVLAQEIKRLMESPEYWSALSENAVQYATRTHAIHLVAARLESVMSAHVS